MVNYFEVTAALTDLYQSIENFPDTPLDNPANDKIYHVFNTFY